MPFAVASSSAPPPTDRRRACAPRPRESPPLLVVDERDPLHLLELLALLRLEFLLDGAPCRGGEEGGGGGERACV